MRSQLIIIHLISLFTTALSIDALMEIHPTPRSATKKGMFFRVLTDNPEVLTTIQHTRSSLECAYQCLQITGCTGFSFLTGCEIYSSELNPSSSASSSNKAVYTLNDPGDCYYHDEFEVMTLSGSNYCIRVLNGITVDGLEARSSCASLGGYVIALDTAAKINDFREILKQRSAYSPSGYWVGLYDLDIEGKFEWDKDGSRIDNMNEVWDSGQPNGLKSGQDDQDCTYLVGDRLLQDKNCGVHHAVNVCEIPM